MASVSRRNTALLLLAAATGIVGMTAAGAAPDVESQPTDTGAQLQEITVSARRREEPLQHVPVAVSVVTGSQAEAHNLNDLQDISSEVPTVEFRTGASNKDRDIFIRGIGTITTSPGVEPSVSTVVDGVVLARPGQATLELLDVDHIEVLRGPQGTLFGKNASAGVVNIVTVDPGPDLHGYADGSYFGGGDEYRLKGGVSGALLPGKLTGLFSGVYSNYDGNVDNLHDGSRANGFQRYGGHGKLIFTPTDDLRVIFNGDFMHSRDTVPTGVPAATSQAVYPTGLVTNNAAFATVLAADGVAPSFRNANLSTDVDSNVRDENGGGSITVEDKLGGYVLTSITAYRKWRNVQDQDYDQISQITAQFPASRITAICHSVRFRRRRALPRPRVRLSTIRPACTTCMRSMTRFTKETSHNWPRQRWFRTAVTPRSVRTPIIIRSSARPTSISPRPFAASWVPAWCATS